MFIKNIKNQNDNYNYQRFYPSSKKGHPTLKKICIFLILVIIIIFIIVFFFRIKKSKNKDNNNSINDKIIEKRKANENLQDEINSLNSEISELNQKSSELKGDLDKLKKEKDSKKEKSNSELSEINSKLSSKEKECKEIEEQTNNINEDIEKIDKENNEAEDKIKELSAKLESLEKEKEKRIVKTSTMADSVILTDDNIKALLKIFDLNLEFNLLYRTSKHGKDISDFQKNVGNHKNLIIVGKTNDNKVIGGYTTSNLEGDGFKEDKYAFLYNFNKDIRFKIKKEKQALYLKKGKFPSFGDGDITFEPGKTKSKFPQSYKGDNLELTEGKSEIEFKDIEVFYLTIIKKL